MIRHWRRILTRCLRASIFCHGFTFSSNFPTHFELLHHLCGNALIEITSTAAASLVLLICLCCCSGSHAPVMCCIALFLRSTFLILYIGLVCPPRNLKDPWSVLPWHVGELRRSFANFKAFYFLFSFHEELGTSLQWKTKVNLLSGPGPMLWSVSKSVLGKHLVQHFFLLLLLFFLPAVVVLTPLILKL